MVRVRSVSTTRRADPRRRRGAGRAPRRRSGSRSARRRASMLRTILPPCRPISASSRLEIVPSTSDALDRAGRAREQRLDRIAAGLQRRAAVQRAAQTRSWPAGSRATTRGERRADVDLDVAVQRPARACRRSPCRRRARGRRRRRSAPRRAAVDRATRRRWALCSHGSSLAAQTARGEAQLGVERRASPTAPGRGRRRGGRRRRDRACGDCSQCAERSADRRGRPSRSSA